MWAHVKGSLAPLVFIRVTDITGKQGKKTMYAIVEIGGKQYKIEKDMVLNVDRTLQGKTDTLAIEKVLMLVDGENVMVGRPYLNNVKVSAAILKEVSGKKVRGIKFKRRKNYTRTIGFRPRYLQVKIQDLALQ